MKHVIIIALGLLGCFNLNGQMKKALYPEKNGAYARHNFLMTEHFGKALSRQSSTQIINMGCALLLDPGFQAIRNGNFVELNWSTCSETNCDGFIVQRSTDSVNYETIALIRPAGRSRQITEYQETDFNPCQGKCSYRLITSTPEGLTNMSKAVRIQLPDNFSEDRTADSLISSKLGLNERQILMVLRDKKGRECFSKFSVRVEKSELLAIDAESRVEPGSYLVIGASNNRIYGKKVKVQQKQE
jgi:hypothetical protein